MLVTRAGGMRLTGAGESGALEMASDGAGVWVRLDGGGLLALAPTAMGSAEAGRPWLALDPFLLSDALLPRHLPTSAGPAERLVFERRESESIVGWLRDGGVSWVPRRRVGLGGTGLAWIELFDGHGALRARVVYSGAALTGGISRHLEIRGGGTRIELELTGARLEPAMSARTFRLTGQLTPGGRDAILEPARHSDGPSSQARAIP